jgi:MFS family permease
MDRNRKITYAIGFLFSVPVALTAYINSSFLSTFVDEKFVGLIFSVASITSASLLILAPSIFRRFGSYKFLLLVAILNMLTITKLILVENIFGLIIFFVFFLSLNTLLFFSLDEILKILSKDSNTGKIRGLYMVLANLGWILAQFSRGTILGNYDFEQIYSLGILIMGIALLIAIFGFGKIKEPEYDKVSPIKSIKKFIREKNLTRAYSFSFLLQVFYSWMIIYTPIYLHGHLGFSWKELGLIFTIMLLPFSFVPLILGKYADKVGERSMLMWGFFIMSVATISIFFLKMDYGILLWALVLFATRVGAATVEAMSDIYFFKHIKPENEEFVGTYRTAPPLAFVIGPMIASLVFLFIPEFKYIYIILGALMLLGINLAGKIKKADI